MPLNPAYDSDTDESDTYVTTLNIRAGGQLGNPQSSALPVNQNGDHGYPQVDQTIVEIGDVETTYDRTDTNTRSSPTPHAQTETEMESVTHAKNTLTTSQIKQRQRFRETLRRSSVAGSGADSSSPRFPRNLPETQLIGRKLLYMKMGPSGDLDARWLEHMEAKFRTITESKGHISVQTFKDAFGLKRSFFAERFFELFDQDDSGSIDLIELMDGLRMLAKGTPAQKLLFLFDVFDVNGSGFIERDELKAVLQACMEESSLSLTNDNIDELTDVLFEAADVNGQGMISFLELEQELEKHPGVIENLTISAAKWLQEPNSQKTTGPFFRYFTKNYWVNNRRKCMFFVVYWLLNTLLFAIAAAYQYKDANNWIKARTFYWIINTILFAIEAAYIQYKDANNWIKVARGCGLCLNFNCAFVVVLMLRKCITFIRMTKLRHVLPLDHHIMFHKHVGMAIVGFSIVHSLAHIGNASTISRDTPLEMWEVLFTTKAHVGFVGGSAFITGWILDVVLIVMAVCSAPFVLRSGHFQVFYWSHTLYVPFLILVILHGPHFWKWFVVPGLVLILEKLFRSKLIKLARYGDTYIDEVNLLPSNVTHLIITRPLNFRYQPGDYVFVQIPVIAQQEWHPFTISSAPEMEGHIWLHVRSAGHWTNKLYEYFDKLQVNQSTESPARGGKHNMSGFERVYSRGSRRSKGRPKRQTNKIVNIKCYIDGPYGTGTREVFNANHVVLVGAGIGVTPMASILQSIWYRFNATRQTCPSCEHVWYSEEAEEMRLKKVDFIWVNRDQKSFEWFLTLLNQLETEQSSHHGALENCIQTHLYMTAAQKKTDMKGIGLQIALDLIYEKTEKDLITGLRTKTCAGRPDFDQLFKTIRDEKKGKVKVFICGPPAVSNSVRDVARKYKFDFIKENF